MDFIEREDIEHSIIFPQLKCSKGEGEILRYMAKKLVEGDSHFLVSQIIEDVFEKKGFSALEYLPNMKNLLEFGWVIEHTLLGYRVNEVINLELLNSSISLSSTFLKLLEHGELGLDLPDVSPYEDHLEYLRDWFAKIELLQNLGSSKSSQKIDSPSISRIKHKLKMLEDRIEDRLKITKKPISILSFLKEYNLDNKEMVIFFALLKEEYSGMDDQLRDMNSLIELISENEYDRIKNRTILDENSKLANRGLIDYDEMLNPFGGISRTFFIPEDILQKIIHPKEKKRKPKITLNSIIKEHDIFELLEPKKSFEDIILHSDTKERLDALLKQVDSKVVNLLKEWGIREKKSGIEAKIIFYGSPGTGKTITALAIAKSLKKAVLSFDCSKILSMYVGESEKNVRKIFDSYRDIVKSSKSEPILLLDEADQFLSNRTTSSSNSAEKMHNQMQNLFLDQIEKFDGILIATTNLLETIDSAFSRRFNYKIEFKKPDARLRTKLWERHLPKRENKNLYEKGFSIEALAKHPLSGGQIALIVKNTAYRVATKDNPIFTTRDFEEEIKREISGNFDGDKMVGFLR